MQLRNKLATLEVQDAELRQSGNIEKILKSNNADLINKCEEYLKKLTDLTVDVEEKSSKIYILEHKLYEA